MRTFRVLVVDEKDEIVVDFPVSAKTTHNGLGGGTDTSAPNKTENAQIRLLLKTLRETLQSFKAPTDTLNKENAHRQSEETQNDN